MLRVDTYNSSHHVFTLLGFWLQQLANVPLTEGLSRAFGYIAKLSYSWDTTAAELNIFTA